MVPGFGWGVTYRPPMDRTRRPLLRSVISALALLAVLSGCGTEGEFDGDGDPDVSVTVQITSDEQRLAQVGPGDSVVYGWNRLVGSGEGDGPGASGTVEVEMLGNVSYRDGNGPFFGFVTFTFDDGATLAVRMEGEATASTDTSDASFSAELDVLGGTGRLVDTAGSGTFEGERGDELGGAVESTFEIWLDDDA